MDFIQGALKWNMKENRSKKSGFGKLLSSRKPEWFRCQYRWPKSTGIVSPKTEAAANGTQTTNKLQQRTESRLAIWDVIVIGVGGVGSATAMHLAKAGVRTLGIDQYHPVHDRGSSHGQTRIIRQAYFEHPCYVPLLQRAYELWHDLEQQSNQKLFHRTGLVELGPSDGIVIPGVHSSAATYRLPIEKLTPFEIHQRWPGIKGEDHWEAIVELNAGFLKVERCVQTHLDLAVQNGCKLIHNCSVHQWSSDSREVRVATDYGIEKAAQLVIAGGPWTRSLVPDLSKNLQVFRKHLYWFEPRNNGYREEDGFPCFFHETESGFFYGFPCINGKGVKIARHSGGQPIEAPDPDAAASQITDERDRQLVIDYASQYLPGLGSQLISSASCYYTSTADENFVIDQPANHQNVTVVAGLSGHGFKFASALGEIASQLALGLPMPFDLAPFAIERFE